MAVVERIAERMVIGFNRAYKYFHLVQGPDRLGPSPPLRDGWTVSTSTLAAKADPAPFEGVSAATQIPGAHNSLSMKVHIEASLIDFIHWHLQGEEEKPGLFTFKAKDFFKEDEAGTRKALSLRLLRTAYEDEQDDHTSTVLKRRGVPHDQFSVDAVHDHFALLPAKAPLKFRRTQFHIIFNALATGKRRMVILHPKKAERHALPLPPCPFCGETGRDGQGGDDSAHFFGGGCRVITQARSRFGGLIGVDLDPDHLISASSAACSCPALPVDVDLTLPLLPEIAPAPAVVPRTPKRRKRGPRLTAKKKKAKASPSDRVAPGRIGKPGPPALFGRESCAGITSPDFPCCADQACRNFKAEGDKFKITSYLAFGPKSAKSTAALFAFNAAVWSDRCNFFITRSALDDDPAFDPSLRLAGTAALNFLGAFTSAPKGFGKAGQRSDRQTDMAREYAKRRIGDITNGDAFAFTDGASRGNPGPSGAGTHLAIKGSGFSPIDHFTALGHSTNNFSELWAIGVALSLLVKLPTEGQPYRLHVLTDSGYSIGCLQGGYSSVTNGPLVDAIRLLKRRLISEGVLESLHLIWVPGHAGLDGNEHADFLANCGADASAAGKGIVPSVAFAKGSFVPD